MVPVPAGPSFDYAPFSAMVAPPLPPLAVDSVQEAWKLPAAEVGAYAARPCTLVEALRSDKLMNDPGDSVEVAAAG